MWGMGYFEGSWMNSAGMPPAVSPPPPDSPPEGRPGVAAPLAPALASADAAALGRGWPRDMEGARRRAASDCGAAYEEGGREASVPRSAAQRRQQGAQARRQDKRSGPAAGRQAGSVAHHARAVVRLLRADAADDGAQVVWVRPHLAGAGAEAGAGAGAEAHEKGRGSRRAACGSAARWLPAAAAARLHAARHGSSGGSSSAAGHPPAPPPKQPQPRRAAQHKERQH